MKLKALALAALVATAVLGSAGTADAQYRTRGAYSYVAPSYYSAPSYNYSYNTPYYSSVPAYNGITSVSHYTPLGGTTTVVPSTGLYSNTGTTFYTPSYGTYYNPSYTMPYYGGTNVYVSPYSRGWRR